MAQPRERTPAEIAAYNIGLQRALGLQANTRVTRTIRRTARVREDEVVLIEEEIYTEDRHI